MGPESEKGSPEGTIERAESRASGFVGVDRELLTKGEFGDFLLALTAKQGRNRGDEDRRIVEDR